MVVPGEIWVWNISLAGASDAQIAAATKLLPADDIARAKRFRLAEHGNGFVLRRAFLRIVLGQLCDIAPADLCFGAAGHGKPILIAPTNSPNAAIADLVFNASHSGEVMALAAQRGGRVGIDIEQSSRDIDPLALARTALTPSETARLSILPPPQQKSTFLNAWTRKEAVSKADGRGLGIAPRAIETQLAPRNQITMIDLSACHDGGQYTLWPLPRCPRNCHGYLASDTPDNIITAMDDLSVHELIAV